MSSGLIMVDWDVYWCGWEFCGCLPVRAEIPVMADACGGGRGLSGSEEAVRTSLNSRMVRSYTGPPPFH